MQTEIDCLSMGEIQRMKDKIQQIILEYSANSSTSTENMFNDLDQITSIIKNLQNEIKVLER